MPVLSAEEVAKWLEQFDKVGAYSDYVHADKDSLFFTHPEASCIDLEYPEKLEKLQFNPRPGGEHERAASVAPPRRVARRSTAV